MKISFILECSIWIQVLALKTVTQPPNNIRSSPYFYTKTRIQTSHPDKFTYYQMTNFLYLLI